MLQNGLFSFLRCALVNKTRITPTNFRMCPPVKQSVQGLIPDHFLTEEETAPFHRPGSWVKFCSVQNRLTAGWNFAPGKACSHIHQGLKKTNKGYHVYPWLHPESIPPVSAGPADSSESREPLLIGLKSPLRYRCLSVTPSCLPLCDPMGCTRQASLPFTISRSWLKLMSIESMMPSNHLPHFFSFTSHIKQKSD